MKRKIVLISLPLLLVLLGIAIFRIKTNEPPEQGMARARKLLSEAELVKSPLYAKEKFKEATAYYDSAMMEWSRENERFILFRSYTRVEALASESSNNSRDAIDHSRKNVSKVEDILEIRMEELGKRMKDFEDRYGTFPLTAEQRGEMVKIRMQYSEGTLAFKNEYYSACKSKLDSVESTLDRLFALYDKKLRTYLNEHPEWKKMVEQTINHSKRNRTVSIVVDKVARELIVYREGKILEVYTVELGANWIGDKQQQGDKSTPEGLYLITDKKSNGQTRYYKALLLDYPNEEDKKRFQQNKYRGVLEPGTSIGNYIEIHGHGGKGIDWTDGCIALRDADMDEVFKFCQEGTRVTIVGSIKSIDELSVNP